MQIRISYVFYKNYTWRAPCYGSSPEQINKAKPQLPKPKWSAGEAKFKEYVKLSAVKRHHGLLSMKNEWCWWYRRVRISLLWWQQAMLAPNIENISWRGTESDFISVRRSSLPMEKKDFLNLNWFRRFILWIQSYKLKPFNDNWSKPSSCCILHPLNW